MILSSFASMAASLASVPPPPPPPPPENDDDVGGFGVDEYEGAEDAAAILALYAG